MSPRRAAVKRTGGGLFDPTEKGIMFAAGAASSLPRRYLVAVNDLYGEGGDRVLESLLDRGHTVLLDSGIFNLTNEHMGATGVTMDEALRLAPDEITGFDRLFDRYVEIATKYGDRLWGYIELDQGGAENKRRTRARLESLGLTPMPVYHPLVDGWDYFDELARGYDRMCMGNVVQASQHVRERLVHTLWERHRAYPDLWVHVLGLTVNEWCAPCPPDSCDSSTWVTGLRYPSVSLGSTALRRLGQITDPAFRYDATADAVASNWNLDGVPAHGTTDWHSASGMYCDEMEFVNLGWRQLRADEDATFGIDRLAPRATGEGELHAAAR